jgi:hypothetical protein
MDRLTLNVSLRQTHPAHPYEGDAPSVNNIETYNICLCKDGKRFTKLVHRLVGKAFITNPDNLPQIDHIDRNKLNNCVTNLRWVSRSTNMKNQKCKGVVPFKNVYKNRNRYISYATIDGVRKCVGTGATAEEAFKKFQNAVAQDKTYLPEA